MKRLPKSVSIGLCIDDRTVPILNLTRLTVKPDIVMEIHFPMDTPSELRVRTNAKDRETVIDLISTYIQDCCIGRGVDESNANEHDEYRIVIGLELSDDSWGITSNTGNKGLTTGILMDVIKRLDKGQGRITGFGENVHRQIDDLWKQSQVDVE